ncbi:hypothetical protein [Deinococcus radiodurans]|uniref:PilN biogenesis protein dimerization domain-containing protein n=1 Tax=Deinococcus radiodurans (strain ATCC 13939 / DSM 20539 / JCM 16871 / CCUG 27074 / LMG 4051 / NBRC 15346 / NCIMB 9279 / VKM B-1422 / R1) TaxID=243230 RepID=Q9RW98_DEIRA|nr:hypothetical protein [Deinococcus radiodurans]AAF10354.1 hypothetical protein DR_0771 [Deinococcus radiodurans R1 = ATCC 13939 = DSM 20539]ANC72011.1 hypothetical protein A2G07_09650 [Deinococcus radiodurans R1 = ATCC 13939 = DSM 20539]QEM72707.1 hypothetical protein DXG80_13610 [Deinococcus radiodurans]QIP32388.1 hypothetical protein HAV35_10025 [Deinococcus radiodurans]UDK99939.1 hypothetical protein E5E91_04005 [Deinococcus radiodurans R1 = ATCC 13939 = DSM 20539]
MVEINLLPKEYRRQSQPSVWKYASWAAAGLTAAVLGGWFLSVSGDTNQLRERSAALQQQIDAVAPQKSRFNDLTAQQGELERVTQVATQLRDQKTYWSNDLASFVERVPGNVVFSNVNMSTVAPGAEPSLAYAGKPVTRQLDLTGSARSQEAIVGFLNAFETDSNFGVDFKGMQHDATNGIYTFTASIGVVGDQPSAAPGADPTAQGAPATGTAPAAPAAPAPTATTPAAAPAQGGAQ